MCKDNNFFHNSDSEFFFIARQWPKYDTLPAPRLFKCNGNNCRKWGFAAPFTDKIIRAQRIDKKKTATFVTVWFPERKTRLELATPTLARLCSTNWAISAINWFWAENETRTRDPNLGKVVLYQLSYFRIIFWTLQPIFLPNCECKDIAKNRISKTFCIFFVFFLLLPAIARPLAKCDIAKWRD